MSYIAGMQPPSSDSSRRDFLLGKSAVRALRDSLTPTELADPAPSTAPGELPETYLLEVGRAAMACDFEILCNAGQHPGSTEAAVAALDLVDELETQMTVYRTTGEVVEINRRAAEAPVTVEPQLFALLQQAVAIYHETGGAFDITSSPLSRAWGFFRRDGRFPREDEIATAKSRTGSHWLELDSQALSIRFLRPEIEINLNAIGKGYALDRCVELLGHHGVDNFLIHGGRSSIVARGSRADRDSHGRGWLVSVKHPFQSERRLAELWLRDRALGTSGSGNQFFHFRGQRYGHIIDPRTGWPADRVLSATVLASNAATADATATALFVMGVDESQSFLASRPELGAILVTAGPRAGEVQLHTFGLDRVDWWVMESGS